MLGDLVKIVLASLREVNIGILIVVSLGNRLIAGSTRCFFLASDFFFEPRRRCGMLEVELMFVVPLFDLLIEVLGPLLEILDIISDGAILLHELLAAFGLDILLVAADDGVVKVVLRPWVLLQNVFILVTNELIVFGLDLILVIGVQVFNGQQLF